MEVSTRASQLALNCLRSVRIHHESVAEKPLVWRVGRRKESVPGQNPISNGLRGPFGIGQHLAEPRFPKSASRKHDADEHRQYPDVLEARFWPASRCFHVAMILPQLGSPSDSLAITRGPS